MLPRTYPLFLLIALILVVVQVKSNPAKSDSDALDAKPSLLSEKAPDDSSIHSHTSSRNSRYAFTQAGYRWPVALNGVNEKFSQVVIRYVIADDVQHYKDQIEDAMVEWQRDTCLKFTPFAEDTSDYVLFKKGSTCHAGYGRNHPQVVEIHDDCATPNVLLRLVGYVLGFSDENERSDRVFHLYDVDLMQSLTNGTKGLLDMFRSRHSTTTYNITYDYTSVMHQRPWRETERGGIRLYTLESRYQGLLGRFPYLSHRDNLMVNTYYWCLDIWQKGCNKKANPCQNEGYLGMDCKCNCRPGTTGKHCQTVFRGYYSSKLAKCSRTIKKETRIKTPNYPDQIPYDTWCVYDIEAPKNCKVKVKFNKFHLETISVKGKHRCYDSFLEIRNKGSVGKMYCGNDLSSETEIISDENKMVMYLDVRNPHSKGFKAQVTFQCKEGFKPTDEEKGKEKDSKDDDDGDDDGDDDDGDDDDDDKGERMEDENSDNMYGGDLDYLLGTEDALVVGMENISLYGDLMHGEEEYEGGDEEEKVEAPKNGKGEKVFETVLHSEQVKTSGSPSSHILATSCLAIVWTIAVGYFLG